jgi:hypothetical protein
LRSRFLSKRKHRSLASDGWVWNIEWSKEVLERIGAVNFLGAKDLEAKQLHMVGYLCELVYDLALAPDQNVSQSPGFETPLGIFGGSDD